MPFGIQPIHIVIIVIIALLIFGPKSLPEVGRWVGRSMSELRKGSQEMTAALREGMNEVPNEEQRNTIAKPAPAQSVPTNDTSAKKFCTKCGSPNPADALFCNKCGNPFQMPS
ncbi:MAG TPA: twin-arginine translocase TatA/TatE family subunit [Anaerolineales bacterium]|nr:twin-arginine translocase TatA/TatE family subunit [Anaerolineales bacterium]